MASNKQLIDIPLHRGLSTEDDTRAMQAPGLSVARDIQFDDLGGVQTRDQYQDITDHVSNTIGTIRKLAAYRDELVAFTKDQLWSYSSGDGLWTSRGEHLAVKVDELPAFVTTGEQFDCDVAELGGLSMYCWAETTPSGTAVYVAASDTATGSVKLSPVQVGGSTSSRPRVTATAGAFIVSYTNNLASVELAAYDPTDITAAASTTSIATTGLAGYDIIQNPDVLTEFVLVVARGVIAGYRTYIYTEALAQSHFLNKLRAAEGAISVAFDGSTGDRMCVSRNSGTAIESDILDGSLVDVNVSISAGTASSATVNQIASVYAVAGTCTLFWSAGESTGSSTFETEWNTVTNAGSAGTEASLVKRVGIASRAFAHDGLAYLWLAFASLSQGDVVGQLQNGYYLVRADSTIITKSVMSTAGGFSSSTGVLPNVIEPSAGLFRCTMQRRGIVPLGKAQKGYSARSPQQVSITFDSDEARRTTQLGETLYISGMLSQYDGSAINEVGFHTFPWDISIVPGGGGSNLAGTYNWKGTYSWFNAQGEFERSTTVTTYSQAITTNSAQITSSSLNLTSKHGNGNNVAQEWWRQIDAAPVGAPYYLVTSKDPSDTGTQGYVENDHEAYAPATFVDDLTDTLLLSRETNPENGGLTLESLAPPPASIIASTQDRLILAGIPGNPNRIVYSKLRGQGEVAAFHDALVVDLPADGGAITGIAFQNETMIVFKETAVFALPGDGYDNSGGGQNYGPARVLASDVGANSAEAIALTPQGLAFHSARGWYLLRGWQPEYIGGKVREFDSDTVLSVDVMSSQHQMRVVTSSGSILIWDHRVNEWAEWDQRAICATIWDDRHIVAIEDITGFAQPCQEQNSTHDGTAGDPTLDVETGWIKLGQLQAYKLIRRFWVLGQYRGTHNLRIRVAYDYDDTWIDNKVWTPSPTTVDGPLQIEHGPSRPKCTAIKIRITTLGAFDGETYANPASLALNLTGLTLEVAQKQGGSRLPAAQKQ